MSSADLDRPQTLVITGAAGLIGRALVPLLRRPGRRLRLIDLAEPEASAGPDGSGQDVTAHAADIGDQAALESVFAGAEAVVHLAGISREAEWDDILRVNISGTRTVLEAARVAGVRRVFLASSIHAVGYTAAADADATPVLVPRPDTYYGVSKAAMEALGSLYADRFGMTIVSARICTFQPEPRDDGRTPALWLSPADAVRLVEAAVALEDGASHIVWGVSANAPGWLPHDAGAEIGFVAEDDAREALIASTGVVPADPSPAQLLGGPFADPARGLGVPW